jgi:hypothetical protein
VKRFENRSHFEYNKIVKICTGCLIEKPINSFSFKNRAKGTRQSKCNACSRILIKSHYQNNREYYLSKAKKRNEQMKYVIRMFMWNYLSVHPCVDCGESDPIVLEFDHISDKIGAVSELFHKASLNVVKNEISKCEVRCANCHRRKTAREQSWYKNIQEKMPL